MNILNSLNKGLENQLKESSLDEFDKELTSIFGKGEQSCSPEEFFDRTRKAREFAKQWNSKK